MALQYSFLKACLGHEGKRRKNVEEICDAVAFLAIIVFVLGIHGAIGFRGKNA